MLGSRIQGQLHSDFEAMQGYETQQTNQLKTMQVISVELTGGVGFWQTSDVQKDSLRMDRLR